MTLENKKWIQVVMQKSNALIPPGFTVQRRQYLMMLEASSASGSAQYLLARIKQASADSICVNDKDTLILQRNVLNPHVVQTQWILF